MRSDTFCICCPQLLQKTWARVPHHFGRTAVAPLTSPTHCTSMPTSWPPTCPSRPQRPALLTRPQCQGSMRWVKMSCDLGSFCFFISWAMASVPLLSRCLSWPPSPATPEIRSCVVLPPRVFLGRSCTAARSFGGTIVVVIKKNSIFLGEKPETEWLLVFWNKIQMQKRFKWMVVYFN